MAQGSHSQENLQEIPVRSDKGMENSTVYLDIETQNGPDDVPGGWGNLAAFKISCTVTCTEGTGEPAYQTWWEGDVPNLMDHLKQYDRIVGFNIKRFDYGVLSGYSDVDHLTDRTIDILDMIYDKLRFRISLQGLAEANFGLSKLGTGVQAIEWWRKGDLDSLEKYCQEDVRITRMLYKKARTEGYLLYHDRRLGEICRVSLHIPTGQP